MPSLTCSSCGSNLFHNLNQENSSGPSLNTQASTPSLVDQGKCHYAPNAIIQPIHTELFLHFQLPRQQVDARIIHTFENKRTHSAGLPNKKDLTMVTLDAIGFDKLHVVSADSSMELDYIYDGRKLFIHWQTAFLPGEKRSVEITYTVIDPIAGLYFHVPNADYPNRVTHCITDHEPERCRYWLPVVDAPAARTTLSFHIKAPKHLMAIANGRKISEELADENTKLTRWILDEAACPAYLICVAVGDFVMVDGGNVNGMPIAFIGPKAKGVEANLQRSFGKTKDMVNWITKRLDMPFPWRKYYQIVSPCISGAMENISFVTWNDLFCCDENLSSEKQLLVDQINVHEMAHTYFGDLLVIRHFDHTWLKESWATYLEAVWIQDHLGEDSYRYEMMDCAKLYIAESNRYVRPIVKRNWESPWSMFDSHAYPGGAWRIHMLRYRLGETSFWEGVKLYLTTYTGKLVETDDFRKCLETTSGLNLVKFFDQWIYGKGYPKLKMSYKFSPENSEIQLKIEQVQASSNELQQSGIAHVFEFDLEAIVVDDSGADHQAVFEFNESPKATIVIKLPKRRKPSMIRLDPKGKILFSIESNDVPENIWVKCASKAEDIWNRLWGFTELIKEGSGSGLRQVAEIIKTEPFWGIRVRVAQALSRAKTKHCLMILADMLRREKNPMALYGICKSCSVRDPDVRSALLEFLQRENSPYRAVAAALENLGEQTIPEDLEVLLKVAKDEQKMGQHAIVRSGALKGLGNHRSLKSYEFLEQRVRASFFRQMLQEGEKEIPREPERAFPALIDALAIATTWQPSQEIRRHVISLLVDLLRDSRREVKRAAIWAICDMDAAVENTQSIHAIKPTIPDQDWMFIDRRLRTARESGEGRVKDLVKTLEEVEGRLRNIEWNHTEKPKVKPKEDKSEDDQEVEPADRGSQEQLDETEMQMMSLEEENRDEGERRG